MQQSLTAANNTVQQLSERLTAVQGEQLENSITQARSHQSKYISRSNLEFLILAHRRRSA
jgi:hypothetical protein